jgi:hypothetical protein
LAGIFWRETDTRLRNRNILVPCYFTAPFSHKQQLTIEVVFARVPVCKQKHEVTATGMLTTSSLLPSPGYSRLRDFLFCRKCGSFKSVYACRRADFLSGRRVCREHAQQQSQTHIKRLGMAQASVIVHSGAAGATAAARIVHRLQLSQLPGSEDLPAWTRDLGCVNAILTRFKGRSAHSDATRGLTLTPIDHEGVRRPWTPLTVDVVANFEATALEAMARKREERFLRPRSASEFIDRLD